MSLTNPDARAKRVSAFLRPTAWITSVLALATAPLLVTIIESTPESKQIGVWLTCMFSYILGCIAFGLLLYYTAAHRNYLGICAYIFAYVAGLVLILGSARDPKTGLPDALYPALVIYAIAAVLLAIYIFHAVAGQATLANGVETMATVTAAGVNGLVNYVQHWKLTLKFTDQQGHDRWFHLGRTGFGYKVGQTFTIKYNPKRPGSRRGIVVLNPNQFN